MPHWHTHERNVHVIDTVFGRLHGIARKYYWPVLQAEKANGAVQVAMEGVKQSGCGAAWAKA